MATKKPWELENTVTVQPRAPSPNSRCILANKVPLPSSSLMAPIATNTNKNPMPMLKPSTVEGSSLFLLANASARQQERSEEHTSELQSRGYLVCRLLIEKKKTDL